METHDSLMPSVTPRYWIGRLLRRGSGAVRTDYGPSASKALGEALSRETILLRRIKTAAEEYETSRAESDHRLINGLQMIVGLLDMQARTSTPDVKDQLLTAAQRVLSIERVHRRLHINDGTKIVAFKKFLEELCADISGLLHSGNSGEREIKVECEEISIPTAIAIPMGFIAGELLTNAIKYGSGAIRVRLTATEGGCLLAISNNGPVLEPGFDPLHSKGLGMKIIASFVRQIGAELRFGPADRKQGAKFAILVPRFERERAL